MTFQVSRKEGFDLRTLYLGKSRRVVVKVGSAVLTGDDGLNLPVMENLAGDPKLAEVARGLDWKRIASLA